MTISKKWFALPLVFLPFIFFQNFKPSDPSVLNPGVPQNPQRTWIDFSCSKNSKSKDCSQKVSCPLGTRPVTARAVCNLEKSTLASTAELNQAPLDAIRVLQKSKSSSKDLCYVYESTAAKGDNPLGAFAWYSSTFKVGCQKESPTGECLVMGQVMCEEFHGPLMFLNAQVFPKNAVQGMARLSSSHLLLAANTGNDKKDQVSFSIVDPVGESVADFEFPYNITPQSLHITKVVPGQNMPNYYQILVNSEDQLGVALFSLSEDFKTMKLLRQIKPTRSDSLQKFSVFNIDEARDRIGLVVWEPQDKAYYLSLYPYSKFYAGQKNIKALTRFRLDDDQNKQSGAMQGLVLSDNFAYVLTGNASLLNKKDPLTHKNLFRYRLDGTAVAKFRNSAGSGSSAEHGNVFRTESLYKENGSLFFVVNSGSGSERIHRIYRMSEKYWPKESFGHELKFNDLSGTGKLFQGLALLPNKNWLVTHDLDSNLSHDRMMFEILDPQGRSVFIKKNGKEVKAQFTITLPGNASHGQSIAIFEAASSFTVMLENGQGTGVSLYKMAKDYSSITYEKDILYSSKIGFTPRGLFAVDQKENLLAVYGKSTEGRQVRIFDLKKFLAGETVPVAGLPPVNVEKTQEVWPQGIAIQGLNVYVLNGNSDPKDLEGNQKLLYRYSALSGKLVDRRDILVGRTKAAAENKLYEPEGLHANDGILYFSLNIRGVGVPMENKVYHISELNF